MDATTRYFLSTYTPAGWNSLGPTLRQEHLQSDACLLLSGPGCGGSQLLRTAAETAAGQGLRTEAFLSCVAPFSPEAVVFPQRHILAAVAAPFGGSVPLVPGYRESYVDLTTCYDRTALKEMSVQLDLCRQEELQYEQRAVHCLSAAEQLTQDIHTTLFTDALRKKLAKRALGILSRECPRTGQEGHTRYRYLSAYTANGHLALFDTVSALCPRVYELVDRFYLSHNLLSVLLSGAVAAGYDVIACLSPLCQNQVEHLLIPALSLAFITSTPDLPWPEVPQRRIHLDAMLEEELLHQQRGRLRLLQKIITTLEQEASNALSQSAQLYQMREELCSACTDGEVRNSLQNEAVRQLLCVSE